MSFETINRINTLKAPFPYFGGKGKIYGVCCYKKIMKEKQIEIDFKLYKEIEK
jgi:hypothetical protein